MMIRIEWPWELGIVMALPKGLFTKNVIWENLLWEFGSSGEDTVIHQVLSL